MKIIPIGFSPETAITDFANITAAMLHPEITPDSDVLLKESINNWQNSFVTDYYLEDIEGYPTDFTKTLLEMNRKATESLSVNNSDLPTRIRNLELTGRVGISFIWHKHLYEKRYESLSAEKRRDCRPSLKKAFDEVIGSARDRGENISRATLRPAWEHYSGVVHLRVAAKIHEAREEKIKADFKDKISKQDFIFLCLRLFLISAKAHLKDFLQLCLTAKLNRL